MEISTQYQGLIANVRQARQENQVITNKAAKQSRISFLESQTQFSRSSEKTKVLVAPQVNILSQIKISVDEAYQAENQFDVVTFQPIEDPVIAHPSNPPHVFGREGLSTWSLNSLTCPTCRAEIPSSGWESFTLDRSLEEFQYKGLVRDAYLLALHDNPEESKLPLFNLRNAGQIRELRSTQNGIDSYSTGPRYRKVNLQSSDGNTFTLPFFWSKIKLDEQSISSSLISNNDLALISGATGLLSSTVAHSYFYAHRHDHLTDSEKAVLNAAFTVSNSLHNDYDILSPHEHYDGEDFETDHHISKDSAFYASEEKRAEILHKYNPDADVHDIDAYNKVRDEIESQMHNADDYRDEMDRNHQHNSEQHRLENGGGHDYLGLHDHSIGGVIVSTIVHTALTIGIALGVRATVVASSDFMYRDSEQTKTQLNSINESLLEDSSIQNSLNKLNTFSLTNFKLQLFRTSGSLSYHSLKSAALFFNNQIEESHDEFKQIEPLVKDSKYLKFNEVSLLIMRGHYDDARGRLAPLLLDRDLGPYAKGVFVQIPTETSLI
jgi:hypothetical protein